MSDSKKICLIGGGYGGVAMGKKFKQENVPFDIYEKDSDFGGVWNIKGKSGRVYENCHTITSKICTQLSDCPMPAHYTEYVSHAEFLEYIRSVATKFKLHENTKFNTEVKFVEPIGSGDQWKVKLSDGSEKIYAGVIIESGKQAEPNHCKYPGEFHGLALHSAEYKSPAIFEGKNVLVVGGGNSGADIAIAAATHAKKAFMSWRRPYYIMPKFIDGMSTQDWLMKLPSQFKSREELWKYVKGVFKLAGFDPADYGLPTPKEEIDQVHPIMSTLLLYHIGHGDIHYRPDIKLLKDKSVVFVDGRTEDIDVIIYCTGFKPHYPYLPSYVFNWQEMKLDDLFMYTFPRRYDNLIVNGIISSPAAVGLVMTTLANVYHEYFKAGANKSKAYEVFKKVKLGPNPDMGEDKFVLRNESLRHAAEVDLWAILKAFNSLGAKLSQSDDQPSAKAG